MEPTPPARSRLVLESIRTGIRWRLGGEREFACFGCGEHTLGLKNDGSLWAWGYNGDDRLGDGTYANRFVPARIGDGNDWSSVAAGADHHLGLKTDGSLWAWGANHSGPLGAPADFSPRPIGTDCDWALRR